MLRIDVYAGNNRISITIHSFRQLDLLRIYRFTFSFITLYHAVRLMVDIYSKSQQTNKSFRRAEITIADILSIDMLVMKANMLQYEYSNENNYP
jgi:hypothetical protein